jgi:hypothetical protein
MDIGNAIYNSVIYICKTYAFIYIFRVVSTLINSYCFTKINDR